ncbi:MAG: MBL fold metallo-hydrolase, partial [Clostridia bacterium]|nr:MBL fold metallo-hydrolase [Clostridia bacterium]
MKLHIFGTCGGSEPMPGRRHVSFAVDHHDRLYWFDAGESASYTAHLMGVDLMRTRAVFISHTHMDHIGGLGNLFWTLRKLDGMHHNLRYRDVDLYIPEIGAWDAILGMLRYTEGAFDCDFRIRAREYGDGILLEEDGLRVTALHNRHLPPRADGAWRSFGFSIGSDGEKVVFSGDTGGVEDLYPLLDDCGLLLMETGHHAPVDVARTLLKA